MARTAAANELWHSELSHTRQTQLFRFLLLFAPLEQKNPPKQQIYCNI